MIFELFPKDLIKMKSKTKKNKKRKVSLIRAKELSLQSENLLKRLRKKGIAALINLKDDERQQVFIWSQEVISQYATLLEKRSRNSASNLSSQVHFPTIDKYKEQAVAEHNTLFQEFNFYNTLISNVNHYFKR